MSSGQKAPSASSQMAQLQAMQPRKPADIALDTTSWGGMGYGLPTNPLAMGAAETGQGLNPPSWATGDWSMPWWGKEAPNVGMALLQQTNPELYAGLLSGPPVATQTPTQGGAVASQGGNDYLSLNLARAMMDQGVLSLPDYRQMTGDYGYTMRPMSRFKAMLNPAAYGSIWDQISHGTYTG